ncbi:T9SS type B sorting domain-containing protein [Flavobacterium sp. I-STPA6A]|uniref:T9SS type B sorting domain-containing protein n=1 Tax=Flavobacterium sp. I-STPA6A TaxID=2590450 RepID=UPI00131BD522|nr:T9SS type B sorting domain-containing protein [Flavobacterium sp. I-STPA6A]
MKKTTFLKVSLLAFMFMQSFLSFSQNLKPFTIRFDRNVKGDQLLIGNNILSENNNDFNDDNVYNSDVDMQYVNIDNDNTTFSSSSAVLNVPNSNAPSSPCYKILYAGLYWSAIIKDGDVSVDRTKFATIKFKTPGGEYNTINGELIYDAINQTDGVGADKSRPYACYANVTSLLQPLTNANGTYTVANVLSSIGKNGNTGLSAGWSLYIVYEDPNLPARSITSYDGFSGIGGTNTLDINVSGFRTIPAGPVVASFAFAALVGDKKIKGNYLNINGVTQSAATATNPVTSLRDDDNFFNSSVTYIDPITKKTANFAAPNRIPASSNTLGYDAGIFIIKNDNNSAIGNGATSAKITLGTKGDFFIYYFNAIAVEIIEPKIILTKAVTDGAGNPANNTSVGLGAILKYELQFQNVGNDNAKGFTITDVLPANTTFRYISSTNNDIEQVPAGVTHTYNAATRTITFTIPDNLVLKNGNKSIPIRFKVVVVPTCSNLTEPCNNIIKNTARSKYTGQINTNGGVGFGEASFPSYSGCTVSAPDSTNFLVGLDDCKKRSSVLCGDDVTLSATGGYASYSWSTSPTGIPIIGTGQTLTVAKPGTYYVKNTANPPCTNLEEIITVADYPAKPVNPLITYADNKNPSTGLIDQCVNDGSLLTKIFLCGDDAFKTINLSSLGATRIIWETTTCARQTGLSDLCPNVSPTCTWTSAAPDGNTFTANTSGQYRVSIYFGGCFSRFYFDVYKNNLKPTADKIDMICGKSGSITIKGVGNGYEYSLTKNSGYQSSNTFPISTAGEYTVYIKQVGVTTNPCIFEVKGITIYKIDFNPIAPFITQPLCHDGKGSIKVYGTAYTNAQYTYELFKGGVSIEKVINSTASENEFKNKDAGDYTYTVTTLDGCSYNGSAKIIAPDPVTAGYSITKSLTCVNGEITVTAQGGKSPYKYSVNGGTFVTNNVIPVLSPGGIYSIKIVDENNCPFTIPNFTVNPIPKPDYNTQGSNVNCYNDRTGVINFNMTNTNGYTVTYSIDNGLKYGPSGVFTGLSAGVYNTILKYTLNGVDCFDTMKTITITQPSTAVTASAGVSELAGCGPAGEGRVRITNPQGGVGPYEYSFDNQGSWTTVNNALKAPGNYILYVKDRNNCIFQTPVTVDPAPASPNFNITTSVDFNCDGSATSTVTVNNPGNVNYTYDYFIDNVKNNNTPSNVFINVPAGPHDIRIEYKLNNVTTFSNLLFENFGYGNDTESPGINTIFYCFERQVVATQCRNSIEINDGDYSVTAKIEKPFGAWRQPGDHTPPTVPPTAKGRCLVVNLGDKISTTDVIYKKEIKDIIPNQPINFELFAKNLLNKSNLQIDASLAVALVDASGVEISTFTTGDIPKTELWEKYPKTPITLDPKGNTTLTFIIRSNKKATAGNDVAIDDISVFQLPKACVTSRTTKIEVPTGKAFTAEITGTKNVACNGGYGEITINATNFDPVKGYQYSLDNGTNWNTTVLTTSPYTITNLSPRAYTIAVRPIGSSIAACTKTFPPVNISQPAPIVVNATKTKATCLTGATIDARSTTGGTPAYKFELINTVAPNTVIAFPANGVLPDVAPGTYLIKATDANSCSNPAVYSITIDAVPTISAAVVPSTALCFDPTTGAQINVSITGGVAPYSYQTKLNGGAFSASSATFTTLSFTHTAAVTGNYVFRVTDSNGCPAETAQQVINAKVTANAQVTTDLDCDTAPNDQAIISGTISGGTAPFTVVLTSGQTTGTLVGPVGTTTTFTYTTGVSGTYQFEITDAIGCKTTTSATINAKVAVTAKATVTDVKCNGENNGSVILEALTGVAPYTFAITAGTATFVSSTNTTANYSGLAPGIYKYTVTDKKNCKEEFSFEVKQPDAIEINASIKTAYTCDGPATIEVIATKGNGGFTYVLKRTVATVETTVATNTTGLFPNLSVVGSYTVTATDAKGCFLTSAPALEIVALNPPINPVFTEKPITCKPTELTSEVTISVTGGKGNLKYEITAPLAAVTSITSATTPVTFTGLTAGASGTTYAFKVTDENNCSVTGTYTVKDVLPVIVNGSLVANVTCKTAADGKLKFTVSGNAGTFTYELRNSLNAVVPIGQSTQTGNVIDYIGLAADTYTLTVTNPSTECKATKVLKVDEPNAALAITAPTISPITCLVNGKVVINTVGGWGNNRYTLKQPDGSVVGPQSTASFNVTQPGPYTISVTDLSGNGCTKTDTFTMAVIVTPSATIDLTLSDLCYDAVGKATIVVTPTVPSPTYMYSINNGTYQASGTFSGLNPGSYIVKVKDTSTGCILTLPAQPIAQELKFNAVPTKSANCIGQDVEITGTVSGGTQSYTYTVTINGTLNTTPISVTGTSFIFTDAIATTATTNTTYKFDLTDNVGCTATSTVIVAPKTNPEFTATPNSTILCNGDATGSITVTIDQTKGASPYVIDVVNTTTTTSYGTKTTGLPAGFYTVKVTDAKGCFTILTGVEIKEPNPIIIDFDTKDLECTGGGVSQGEIIINGVTGGTGLYNYYVTGINYSEEELGKNGGSAVFKVVNFGLYQIRVVDANGCSEIISNVIIAAPPGYLDINIVTTATCAGGAATVTVGSAYSSTGPFHFNKYTGPGQVWTADGIGGWQGESPPGSKSTTFTDLIPGITYSFIVYDEITNCYYYQTATTPIPTTTSLVLNNVVANNRTCFGSNDGSVSFDIVNNYASSVDVSYQVYEALSNLPITGLTGTGSITAGATLNIVSLGILPVGSYYVLVQETSGSNTGCGIATSTFNIKESVEPLILNASSPTNDNCGSDKGIIEAFAQGGTVIKEDLTTTPPISAVPYLYQVFVDNGTPGVIDALLDIPPTAASFTVASHTSNTFNKEAGHYIVYVRDAYGCIEYKFVEVKLDPEPVITAVVNSACAAEGAFVIDVVNTTVNGIAPYTYSLDGGEFVAQTALSFPYTNISSGDHTVEVKDFNGCKFKVTLPKIAVPLGVNASFTAPPTCKVANGEITAVVTGGSPAPAAPANHFEYTLINNTVVTTPNVIQLDNAVFTNQAAGNYTVQVKDLVTGCAKSTTVDFLIPTDVDVLITDISTTPIDCNALNGTNNNGTLTVNLRPVNDNLDYTYALSGTLNRPAQPSNVFKDLTPGTYDVTVTSGRGCQATVSGVIIADPVAVTATATATPFSCAVDPAKTTALVEGFGGTGTYTFSTDGFNYFTSNSTPVADNKYTFNLEDNSAIQDPIFYVKDSNGCVQTTKLTTPLNPLPKLMSAKATLSAIAGSRMDCLNGRELIQIDVVGGATPTNFSYQVAIDGGNYGALVPITAGATSFTYPATSIGSFYEFKITDNTTGCSIISNAYTVPVFNTMTVTASAFKNVDCFNSATGQIEINIGNYTGDYDYTILKGGVPTAFTGSGNTATNPFVLPHGLDATTPVSEYTVVITQKAYPSCIKPSNTVIITEPAALNLSRPFVTVKNQNCKTSGAVVTVDDTKISGGKGDYTYVFVRNGTGALPPAADFKFTNTATFATSQIAPSTDTVEVWVKDANGCYSFVRVPISLDSAPTVTARVASQCPSPTGYTIIAVGTGGVGTLQYSLDGNSFQPSSSLSVTSPGDYTVWVKDANDCIANTALKVTIFEPLQLRADVTLSTCIAANGVVTLTGSGGSAILANYEYKIGVGGTYGSSNVFSGLAASATPYTFYVRDISTVPACEKSVDVTMLLPNQDIDFTLDVTQVTCKGENDGTITVKMAALILGVNDNPKYTYSLAGTSITGVPVNVGPQDSPLFKDLAASDVNGYTVTVTSGRGCNDTATRIIDEPGLITVPAPAVVQFGCASGNSSNLATITVTGVNGGSGRYLNYEFIKIGTPSNTQVYFGDNNTYTVTDLAGGSYIVQVYDDKGCVGTSTTPIDIAPYIKLETVTVNVDQAITCSDLENITVSVATTGGPATNLEYTIVYRDPITGAFTGLYPTTTTTDGKFTDLPIGDYNITVRNLDTDCELRAVHIVNNPNTFDLVVNATTDITCLDDNSGTAPVNNGTATITLVDGLITTTPVNGNDAGAFTYTLEDALGNSIAGGTSTSAGPITLTGLAAGSYKISATLSQTPSCTVTKNFTIGAPAAALDITETHTEITCATGKNDGSISVGASGGWPGGYEFELVAPTAAQSVAYGTQTVFSGLTAGSYTVNVRDSKGCVNSEIVVLNNPTEIAFVAVPSSTLVDCINDTDASIRVTTGPTGGSGSYLYTLIKTNAAGVVTTNGPQMDNTFVNLGAGTYQVRVSDSWSCATTSSNIVINEPTRVTAALTLATAKTCATNATLTLTAGGGNAPYDYSTTADFAIATAMTSNPVSFSVPVGTYSYYIRDNKGCISFVSSDVKIDEIPTLTLELDRRNARVNCAGDSSGVIVASAKGGLGNYVYTLLNDAGNPLAFVPTQTTPGNFTNLPAGNYVVRVVSQDCAAVNSNIVIISEPLLPLSHTIAVTPITCAGEGNGRIVLTGSGGTGIIKYAISPRLDQFFESGIFNSLKSGFYDYIVQDENGCYIAIKGIEIKEPGSVFVNVVPNSSFPEVCSGDADGAFSVNIIGGNAPYSVSLNNRNGTYTTGALTQSQFDFNGLSGNKQMVYIRDANGCESDITILLGEPVILNPKAEVNYDCENNSQVNSVTISEADGNSPADLDYSLDGLAVQLSNVYNNLSAGRHTVDVRHTNGCTKQVSFVVDQINPIMISLSDGGLNEIVTTVSGGYGNYQYSLNGEPQGSQSNFIIYKSGDYSVTVTDANGCTATATRFFKFIDIKIPTVFTPNGDGNNDTWAPTNTINYKDLIFEVFDRYGRKLGTYIEGQSWNGKYNGNELPSGDYWYILRLKDVKDPREFVGHFTLYR